MTRRSTRLSYNKGLGTSRNDLDAAKRRMFKDSEEKEAHKVDLDVAVANCQNSYQRLRSKFLDADHDTSSVSIIGISISLCCILVIVLSFCEYLDLACDCSNSLHECVKNSVGRVSTVVHKLRTNI